MGRKRKSEKSEEEIRRKIKKLQHKLQATTRRIISSSEEDLYSLPQHQLDVDCGLTPNDEAYTLQPSPLPDSPRASSPCQVSPSPGLPPAATLLASPQCTRPLSPTPGPSAKAQLEVMEDQELDEDTLQMLGDAPKMETPRGPPIHKDVANRWQDILTNGLARDVKEKLLQSYPVPSNCDLLLAPALNLEVRAALQDTLVKRDSALMYKQKQLGVALSALASVTDMIISNETSKQKLLKPISDACRLLCDSHFWETKTRRSFVMSSINVNLKDALLETKRGSLLFGENVTDKVKAAKTIQQSGDALKHSTQKGKFDRSKVNRKVSDKGHLNYNPQHRKTDHKPNNRRAARPAQRMPPPHSNRRSHRYSSPKRAAHRQ